MKSTNRLDIFRFICFVWLDFFLSYCFFYVVHTTVSKSQYICTHFHSMACRRRRLRVICKQNTTLKTKIMRDSLCYCKMLAQTFLLLLLYSFQLISYVQNIQILTYMQCVRIRNNRVISNDKGNLFRCYCCRHRCSMPKISDLSSF